MFSFQTRLADTGSAALVALAVLLGALAVRPSEATAQVTEDVVYLKDGGVVRGVIVEQIPNESVLIRTRDGNQFRYQFSQITKLTREAATTGAPVLQASPQTPLKSPGTALALSLLIPGAGQIYNGQTTKGLLHLGLVAAATWTAITGFASEDCAGGSYTVWDAFDEQYEDRWSEGGDCIMGYAGLGALLGVRVWSLFDAHGSAKAINRRGRVGSLRVEPLLGASPGMRVRLELAAF